MILLIIFVFDPFAIALVLMANKIFDIEEDKKNEGVSDAVSDAVNDDLLDFSGDTTTKLPVMTIPEVKLVPTEEVQPQPKQEFVPPAGDDEVMKQILATDPDAPQGKHKSVNDMLVKKRDYQHVIKRVKIFIKNCNFFRISTYLSIQRSGKFFYVFLRNACVLKKSVLYLHCL